MDESPIIASSWTWYRFCFSASTPYRVQSSSSSNRRRSRLASHSVQTCKLPVPTPSALAPQLFREEPFHLSAPWSSRSDRTASDWRAHARVAIGAPADGIPKYYSKWMKCKDVAGEGAGHDTRGGTVPDLNSSVRCARTRALNRPAVLKPSRQQDFVSAALRDKHHMVFAFPYRRSESSGG